MRALIAVLVLSSVALADDRDFDFGFASKNPGPDLWWSEAEVKGMSEKLTRGLTNIATGWLEFPKRIAAAAKAEGPYPGLRVVTGVFEGAGMAAARTWAGIWEAGTFYSACPQHYDPILEPTYAFE